MRRGICAMVAAGLLSCLSVGALCASTHPAAFETNVRRSARTTPRKFVIHPNGATVGVNQTQRFAVTDSQGNPAAVRWNVSGIGCDHAACGYIDDQGVYKPPSSLQKPRVVILEGVVVADPRYSVLTEIHLETTDTAPANSGSVPLSAKLAPPTLTPPTVVRADIAPSTQLPALPRAVNPPPTADGLNVMRSAGLLPLPSVVPGTPTDPRRDLARGAELVPLPHVVRAAPSLGGLNAVRTINFLPLASAIAAPQSVERLHVPEATNLPPLPQAIGATPAIDGLNGVRAANLPPRLNVIGPAPAAGGLSTVRTAELLKLESAISPPPFVERRYTAPLASSLPLPSVVASAPSIERENLHGGSELPPLPHAVQAAPVVETASRVQTASVLPLPSAAKPMSAPSQVFIGKAQDFSRPAPGTATGGTSAMLQPMTEEMMTPPAANGLAPQHGALVTYRDGLLTIDVRDMTLAEVLKLVAQKTGATIEIPPGTGLERIVEHAGPGPAKDVLAHLLDGSSFNFVIVSSAAHPQDPAQVLLSLQRPDTAMPSPVPAVTTAASAALWTPPDDTLSVAVLPAHLDDTLTVPKETLSPEALSEFMRAKFQELREKAQQQHPQ